MKSKINIEKKKDFKFGFKKFMIKSFLKIGIACFITYAYVHTISNQVIKNDQSLVENMTNIVTSIGNDIGSSFISLLRKGEGFTNKFYLDNKGVAIGYGYNPTQNDAKYNKDILDYAKVDEATQKKIIENANKYNGSLKQVPDVFKDVKLTTEQVNKMALYSKMSYEKDFVYVLKEKMVQKGVNEKEMGLLMDKYKNLPDNQKNVFIHMTYKVGKKNLEGYNTFFSNVINYLKNETKENRLKVANSFVYNYTSNGKRLRDTRVEKLHAELFMTDVKENNPQINTKVEKTEVAKNKEKELSKDEKFLIAKKQIDEQLSLGGLKTFLLQSKKRYEENKANNKDKAQVKPNTLLKNNKEQEIEEENYYDDDEYEYTEEVVVVSSNVKNTYKK